MITLAPTSSEFELEHEAPTTPKPDGTPPESTARQRLTPFSDEARTRVNAATIDTAHRCLVTHSLPQYAVHYAHLLPRTAKDEQLTRLEFAWGLRWGTLNVDTRFNVLRLRADLHALFDSGCFILLPELDEIEKYLQGDGKPDFDGDRANNVRYKYTLIFSKDMDGYPLHRLRYPSQPGEGDELTSFSHPFADFPTLQSHVHPCFAICHASRTARHFHKFVDSTNKDLWLRYHYVIATHSIWMASKPDAAFRKQPKLPSDDDDDDDHNHSDGGQTRTHRLDEPAFLKSVRCYDESRKKGPRSKRRKENLKGRWVCNIQRDSYDDTNWAWQDVAEEFVPDPDPDSDSDPAPAQAPAPAPEDRYQRKQEFVQDWVSSIVEQKFVEEDETMSQKGQTS